MGLASPIKWVDFIVAALLIFTGGVIWGSADRVVGHFLQEQTPDRDEFLARPSVRNSEFALKRVQAELDSTRAKWIEQQVGGTQSLPKLRARMDELERQVSATDAALAAARAEQGRDVAIARQFDLSRAQAELDATRAKWVAERLSNTPAVEMLREKVQALEESAIKAEASVIEARKHATREFAATYFRFNVLKRLWVLTVALPGTAVAFGILFAAGKPLARELASSQTGPLPSLFPSAYWPRSMHIRSWDRWGL